MMAAPVSILCMCVVHVRVRVYQMRGGACCVPVRIPYWIGTFTSAVVVVYASCQVRSVLLLLFVIARKVISLLETRGHG